MGPRKPEVEYISLSKLQAQKRAEPTEKTREAYKCLEKLANNALKSGPYSITFDKKQAHTAPTGDMRDFLSYAPYWWPEHPNDRNTKYIRKDGKKNPDVAEARDQCQLESVAESIQFLCLGYFFFNNENYAIHAVSLLDSFFVNEKTRMNPNLNYAQFVRGSQNHSHRGRGEGVISSRALSRIANLLPLLDAFHGYYALKQYIHSWFGSYLEWLQSSRVALEAAKATNNIHTWYTVQVAAIEQFLHPVSPQVSNVLYTFFKESLPKQMDAKTGNQPHESKRTRPLHYLTFNLQAIVFLAEVSKDVGLDVCRSNDLVKLATYITKYASDDNQDITEAVRCVEIIANGTGNQDETFRFFLDKAYHCKFAEKMGGPKNAIHVLWS
ncbi:putative alginate lyase [Parasitella parasitica]|nr:putative alginate lyase [Parasitella parasitica]